MQKSLIRSFVISMKFTSLHGSIPAILCQARPKSMRSVSKISASVMLLEAVVTSVQSLIIPLVSVASSAQRCYLHK